MADVIPFTWSGLGLDKKVMQEQVRESYERMGILQTPTLSAEELQARMREEGVRPEDNLASNGIIAARDHLEIPRRV